MKTLVRILVALGLCLAVGFLTTFAALGFVGLMTVAYWLVHKDNGFMILNEGWEYVFILAVAAVTVAMLGPLEWSIDNAIGWDDELDGYTGLIISAGGGVAAAVALMGDDPGQHMIAGIVSFARNEFGQDGRGTEIVIRPVFRRAVDLLLGLTAHVPGIAGSHLRLPGDTAVLQSQRQDGVAGVIGRGGIVLARTQVEQAPAGVDGRADPDYRRRQLHRQ